MHEKGDCKLTIRLGNFDIFALSLYAYEKTDILITSAVDDLPQPYCTNDHRRSAVAAAGHFRYC